MKAQIIHSFGDSSVFQLEEVSKPKLLPGHVLIDVKATSVNPIDTKMRSGAVSAVAPEFPAILHGDVAGIVIEVGEGVSKFKSGIKYTDVPEVLKKLEVHLQNLCLLMHD